MIPIIIIHRDRPGMLNRCLKSIELLGDGVCPVVHDNGTTYPEGVKYLKELESKGIAVHYYSGEQTMDSISELVRKTVNKEIIKHNADYYIVTDCDIELCEDTTPKLIDFYMYLLNTFKQVTCVGTMLRIDDLLKNDYVDEQIMHHINQFWHKTPLTIVWENVVYEYQVSPIDTTFAMYRSDFEFRRLNMGLRTYAPFWARHLDWYVDPTNCGEERTYYMNHCNNNVSTSTRHYEQWGFKK